MGAGGGGAGVRGVRNRRKRVGEGSNSGVCSRQGGAFREMGRGEGRVRTQVLMNSAIV